MAGCKGPSPSTALLEPSRKGSDAEMMRLSSASEAGPCSVRAAMALAGIFLIGIMVSRSIISSTREAAALTRPGMACVSGRLRQYFFGMC